MLCPGTRTSHKFIFKFSVFVLSTYCLLVIWVQKHKQRTEDCRFKPGKALGTADRVVFRFKWNQKTIHLVTDPCMFTTKKVTFRIWCVKLMIICDLVRLLRLFWIIFSPVLFVNKAGDVNEMYRDFVKQVFLQFALSLSERRNMTNDNASVTAENVKFGKYEEWFQYKYM